MANVTWTIIALINQLTNLFAEKAIPSPRLSAEVLLCHVLSLTRVQLYLQQDRPLTDTELESLRMITRRRLKHEPLQYITEKAYFHNLELRVSNLVLIPRPETEQLVQLIFDEIQAPPITILDVGTGSGCIAITLAQHYHDAVIHAIDYYAEVLEIANFNVIKYGLLDRIRIKQNSFAQQLDEHPQIKFDLLVSNPPYISNNAILPLEVANWEPHTALFAGEDGLELIRQLLSQTAQLLNHDGLLAFEFGDGQEEAVESLAKESHWTQYQIYKDLNEIPRFFLGQLK